MKAFPLHFNYVQLQQEACVPLDILTLQNRLHRIEKATENMSAVMNQTRDILGFLWRLCYIKNPNFFFFQPKSFCLNIPSHTPKCFSCLALRKFISSSNQNFGGQIYLWLNYHISPKCLDVTPFWHGYGGWCSLNAAFVLTLIPEVELVICGQLKDLI